MFWFTFGFLLGLLSAVAVTGWLAWWLVRGANRQAAVKFLEGLAEVGALKPRASPTNVEPPSAGKSWVNTAGNGKGRFVDKAKDDNRQVPLGDSPQPGNANDGRAERYSHDR